MSTTVANDNPQILQRHLDRIAAAEEGAIGTTSTPDGTLGTRPAPRPHTNNAAFAQLTAAPATPVTRTGYLAAVDRSLDEARPLAFVVNAILPASDIGQIPDMIQQVLAGQQGFADRVGFVFNLNVKATDPGARQAAFTATENAITALRNNPRIRDLPQPVAFVASTFGTKSFEPGKMRNLVLQHPATRTLLAAYHRDGHHPYVAVQDFDLSSRLVSPAGPHVFNHFENLLAPLNASATPATPADPDAMDTRDPQTPEPPETPEPPFRPLMFAGGYRPDDLAAQITAASTQPNPNADLVQLGQPGRVTQVSNKIRADMAARDAQAKVHPLLPYSPEPNLFVDGLVVMADPTLSFGLKGAEFTNLAKELNMFAAGELAERFTGSYQAAPATTAVPPSTTPTDVEDAFATQDRTEILASVAVHAGNYTLPGRGPAFVVDFAGGAVSTDLLRLARGVLETGKLPQDHAPAHHPGTRFYESKPSRKGTSFKDVAGTAGTGDYQTSEPLRPTRRGVTRPDVAPGYQAHLGNQPVNTPSPAIAQPMDGTFAGITYGIAEEHRVRAAYESIAGRPEAHDQRWWRYVENEVIGFVRDDSTPPPAHSLYHAVTSGSGMDPKALRDRTLAAFGDPAFRTAVTANAVAAGTSPQHLANALAGTGYGANGHAARFLATALGRPIEVRHVRHLRHAGTGSLITRTERFAPFGPGTGRPAIVVHRHESGWFSATATAPGPLLAAQTEVAELADRLERSTAIAKRTRDQRSLSPETEARPAKRREPADAEMELVSGPAATGDAQYAAIRDLLGDPQRMPDITVLIDEALNFGHQTAGVTLIESLRQLGHRRDITVVASTNVWDKLDTLLPPGTTGINRVTQAKFDPEQTYTDARQNQNRLVLIGAADTLDEDGGENLLDYLGADQAIVFKPYAWQSTHRLAFSRTGPGEDVTTVDLDEVISPDAIFTTDVPAPEPATVEATIHAALDPSPRAAGLVTIAQAALADEIDVMPVYGLHRLDDELRPSAGQTLAHGVHEAALGRPAVILEISDSRVDYAPATDNPPWLTTVDLNAGEQVDLTGLGAGDVVVVRTGNLPQDVFRTVYQLGSLPAVLEGANTANLVQLINRPYFSPRPTTSTEATRFPRSDDPAADAAAISTLGDVTTAIQAGTDWSVAVKEDEDDGPFGAIGRIATATSVLKSRARVITDPAEAHLTQEDFDRLRRALPDSIEDDAPQILGDTAVVAAALAHQPTDGTQFMAGQRRRIPLDQQMIEQWQALLDDRRAAMVAEASEKYRGHSNAPSDAAITTIATAITDLRNPDSALKQYFDRVATAARDPRRDQVLQGLSHFAASRPGATLGSQNTAPAHTEDQDRLRDTDYPFLLDVNPLREQGGELATNCYVAAIATDMSLATGGIDRFQAGGAVASPSQYLANYAGRPLDTVRDLDQIRDILTTAGPGARGIVTVQRHDGSGHAFNVVHDHNGVVFLDGQAGHFATLDPSYRRISLVSTGDREFPAAGLDVPATPAPLVSGGVPDFGKTFEGTSVGVEIELSGVNSSLEAGSARAFGYVASTDGTPLVMITKDMSTGDHPSRAKWKTHTLELVTYPVEVSAEGGVELRKQAVLTLLDHLETHLATGGSRPLTSADLGNGLQLVVTNKKHEIGSGAADGEPAASRIAMPVTMQQVTVGIRATDIATSTDPVAAAVRNAPWYHEDHATWARDELHTAAPGLDVDRVAGAYTYVMSAIDFVATLVGDHSIAIGDYVPPGGPSTTTLTDPKVKNAWAVLPRTTPINMISLLPDPERIAALKLIRETPPPAANPAAWQAARAYIVFQKNGVAGHGIDDATIGGEPAALFEHRTVTSDVAAFVPSRPEQVLVIKDLASTFGDNRKTAVGRAGTEVSSPENAAAFADWMRTQVAEHRANAPADKLIAQSAVNQKMTWLAAHRPQTWQAMLAELAPAAPEPEAPLTPEQQEPEAPLAPPAAPEQPEPLAEPPAEPEPPVPPAAPEPEPQDPPADDEIVAPAAPVADDAPPPSEADTLRAALPGYLTRNESLGMAEQIRATQDADIAAQVRALAPTITAATLAELRDDVRNGLGQFVGAPRPYPTMVNGRPAELRVTATLDFTGLTLDPPAPGDEDTERTLAGETRAAYTNRIKVAQDHHIEGRVGIGVMPPAVFGAGLSVPTAPNTSQSNTQTAAFRTTTEVVAGGQTKITVPVTLTATLVDADGRIIGTGPVTADGSVGLSVATALTEPPALPARADDAPDLAGEPPKRFGVEQATARTAAADGTYFEQVETLLGELGLGDVTRIGAPGRTVLQQMFSDTGLAGNLSRSVAYDTTDPHKGWVTSDPLLRAPKGWRRLFPGKDRAIQYRTVARQVQVVDEIDEAEHHDDSRMDVTGTAGTSAERQWGGYVMAGVGADAAPIAFVVGPKVGVTRRGAHKQEIAERVSTTKRVTAKGPAVRYQTVYELQVRVIGHPPRFLAGRLDALQWTTRDRARHTPLYPDDTGWQGRTGANRTHFGPAQLEQGTSFGGAIVDDLSGGDKVYDSLLQVLRNVPGNKGLRVDEDTFLKQFGDPTLARGLTAGVQAILSRDSAARTKLSNRQLRYLLDRIVGPGLELPLIKQGKLHDYTTVVTVRGTLDGLSDGELTDRGTIETDAKRKIVAGAGGGKDTSTTLDVGVDATVMGPVGTAGGALFGGPRVSHTWVKGNDIGVERRAAVDSRTGPALTEDGDVGTVPMREFAGTLQVTAQTRSSVRLNANARRLSLGTPGRHLPDVVATGGTAPRTFPLKLRFLVPEHRVSTTAPPAAPVVAPANQAPIANPAPLNEITGGYPDDLDGARIESFVGLEHLQEAVRNTLVDAAQDPIFRFPDGRISAAIGEVLSPERLTGHPEVFSKPVTLANLTHSRRAADAIGDAKVRLRPTNPRILAPAEYEKARQGRSGGTSSRSRHGWAVDASVSAGAFAAISGPATDRGDHTSEGSARLAASLTPWQRTWGKVTEKVLAGRAKLRTDPGPQRRVLVQVDVEAEIVAEARHASNLDLFGLGRPTTGRAGQQFTMPDAVLIWLTEDQVHRMRTADLARDGETADRALREQHLQETETQQHDERTQRQRQLAEHATELAALAAGPARDALLQRQATQVQDLTQRQVQRRTTLLARQQGEQAAAQQHHAGRVAALAGLAPAAVPVTPPARQLPPVGLTGAGTVSYGIGGVASTIDLSDQIAPLRRRLAAELGEPIANALLPDSPGAQPHDNVRALQSFLADAHHHAGSAANGGQSLPLRLEGRWKGHTYHATLSAAFVTEPAFDRIEHVDELSVTDRATSTLATTDSRGRTLASVALTVVGQGAGTHQPTGAELTQTTGTGPGTMAGGGGVQASAALGTKNTTSTASITRDQKQSLSVSGPIATYRGSLRVDLTVTGAGLPADGVAVSDTRVVDVHQHPGASRPAGPLGVAHRVRRVRPNRLGDDSRQRWRDAAGHDTLPEPGRFAVEHVFADLTVLHRAAEQALVASGAAIDENVRTAIRNGITTSTVKAGLAIMSDGRFLLPLPAALGRDLILDARLLSGPRFAGVDADIDLEGSAGTLRSDTVERTAGHRFGIRTQMPIIAGGVNHPHGAKAVGPDDLQARHPFGAVNDRNHLEQPLYATTPDRMRKGVATRRDDGDPVADLPVEDQDTDDPVTRGLSYGVAFRFIARSHSTSGGQPRHRAGIELTVDDAVSVRMDDASALARTGEALPPALREAAIAVAEQGTTWTAAIRRRAGLAAQPAPDPVALAAADDAITAAETAWWDARATHDRELAALHHPPAVLPPAAPAIPPPDAPAVPPAAPAFVPHALAPVPEEPETPPLEPLEPTAPTLEPEIPEMPETGRWATPDGTVVRTGPGTYTANGTPQLPGPAATPAPPHLARVFDSWDATGGGQFTPDHPLLSTGDEMSRALAYLDAGTPVLTTGTEELDVYDTEAGPVVPLTYRTDGRWIWTDAAAYYLRTYALSPDERLLADLRARDYHHPPVDPAAARRALAQLIGDPQEDSP
ncbi:actin cross-linking domain-containing toxin [Actinoplanes awajinensis]|uniref:actin cross-linking domain-containing toxin n=1 Tax=Actinoplanes awajinensis TaxID=135946 RepID=UPI001E284604|nr:actin cross-linking domain-containing toxin [Actinoplanes awajinensis]